MTEQTPHTKNFNLTLSGGDAREIKAVMTHLKSDGTWDICVTVSPDPAVTDLALELFEMYSLFNQFSGGVEKLAKRKSKK
jgi:hypothetical protein